MCHTHGVETSFERLAAATADLEPPFAAIDQRALEKNASDLLARARTKPVRIATKSVRVRSIINDQLDRGFHGVMTYSLAESLWLFDHGVTDILLAYPSVDRQSFARLAADRQAAAAITVMIDSVAGLDFIDNCLPSNHGQIRIALDIDASYRIGPVHLGARRSPLHTVNEVEAVARVVNERIGFELVGVMFYDAQIAGLADSSLAVRMVKKLSNRELLQRRHVIVEKLREFSDIEIVNGGGTGSLHITAEDSSINELTAGSGLFHSHHFDGYRDFVGQPAAFFVTSVVRKPTENIATMFSGGFLASGAANKSRLPKPVWPKNLTLLGTEGAGEVQTPLLGAQSLTIGDRVWFRHTKAGEMCERFNEIHIIDGEGNRTTVPTYRGEGKNFG